MNSNHKYIDCPLCGQNNNKLRFKSTKNISKTHLSEKELNPNVFCCTSHELGQHGNIVQCENCGMVYNNPQPTNETLLKTYQKVEDPLYIQESEARERTFKKSLRQIHHFIRPPGKLLDLGCYTGTFMKIAAEAKWQVEGIELSTWAAEVARKKNIGTVYEEPLHQLSLPKNSYDIVTMWDVLEHLQDPTLLMRQIHRILKPNGWVAMSTHMVDSWAARILGTRYPFFMEMHLSHFSRSTVSKLLKEQGFQLEKIQNHPRILKTGYFLEKISHKVKTEPFLSIIKWMNKQKWVSNRFIKINFLGLVNIFARKSS